MTRAWSDELVRRYVGSCDDVPTLRQWIELCHTRISDLGFPPYYGIEGEVETSVRVKTHTYTVVGRTAYTLAREGGLTELRLSLELARIITKEELD